MCCFVSISQNFCGVFELRSVLTGRVHAKLFNKRRAWDWMKGSQPPLCDLCVSVLANRRRMALRQHLNICYGYTHTPQIQASLDCYTRLPLWGVPLCCWCLQASHSYIDRLSHPVALMGPAVVLLVLFIAAPIHQHVFSL